MAPAEQALREALAIQRNVLGEHRDTADTLGTLGAMLRAQNKLPEAEVSYRDCLEMRRKVLGNDHAQATNALRNLTEVLRLEGKFAEAEALMGGQDDNDNPLVNRSQ